MNAKAGTVISEQTVPTGYNTYTPASSPAPQKSEEQKIGDGIVAATQGAGTNEKNFLASVNKIKSATQFWNVNSYLKTVGNKLDFAGIVNDEMDNADGPDVQTIVDKLKSIGVNVTADINEYNNFKPGSFKWGGSASAAVKPEVAKLASDRQKNINNIFCSVKNGVIVNPSSSFNNLPWEKWKETYKPTEAELTVAKSSCSSGQRSRQGSVQSGPSVNTRFADSVKSLGVQNGKMDLQTLQTVLKNLEGETSTAAAPTQGTPDLAQLTAALNQLES
jgi:hypothetical protein